ncbi:MAG: HEPN domain-containing protein [Lachnospiraceae bacterium]|nr:HEPN domain-containing protein [Lachnospiraceae bacterium]
MNEHQRSLSEYRLEKSRSCLRMVQIAIEADDYCTSANRSYYAIFHCMRALLAVESIDYKKHSAVISHFQREYIKTGVFEEKLSDYVRQAFTT